MLQSSVAPSLTLKDAETAVERLAEIAAEQLNVLTAQFPATMATGDDQKLRWVRTSDEADLLVIFPNSDMDAIRHLRLSDTGHLLPLIDLTGRFSDDADLSIPPEDTSAWPKAASLAATFSSRRQSLTPWTGSQTSPEYRLLAYLAVGHRLVRARYAPSHPNCISYGAFPPISDVTTIAEKLAGEGLLTRTFFDRLQSCPHCASSRLNVREECDTCRSSEIADVGLLHHYRCAYLGPAKDFEAPDRRLICPKCAKELRHYGSDHERAGEAVECLACGHVGDAAAVGFVCMDCNARFDAAAARLKSIFHYAMSDAGHAALQSPHRFASSR